MGTYERASRQTKFKIISAFWKLYKEKRIEKITVRDITDLCGIHRATFYLHYQDVYQVLERIKSYLLQELSDAGSAPLQTPTDLTQFIRNLYTLYEQRREYLHLLLVERPDPDFLAGYRQIFMTKLCLASGVDPDTLPSQTRSIVEMTMYGMVDMFIFWADGDQLTFDDMLTISRGFFQDGIAKTLERELGVRFRG